MRPLDRRTFLQTALAVPAATALWHVGRSAIAAAATSGISGHVVSFATRQPIAGARVGVRFRKDSVQTGADGSFVLPLPPGTYEVTCHASGYIGASRPSAVVISSQSTQVDFALLPLTTDPTVIARLADSFRPGSQIGLLEQPASDRLRLAQTAPCSVLLKQSDGSTQSIELNEYLRGVVPSEMPALWGSPQNGGFEALKSQAVAARTYAVAAMLSKGYLWPDTRDQAWNPNNINDLTDRAIAETGYEILTYSGSIITAFYSASCGGHGADGGTGYTVGHRDFLTSPTATPERLDLANDDAAFGFWGPGQSPEAFCKNTGSTTYRWTVQWQRANLESILDTYLAFVSQQTGTISPAYNGGDLGMLVGIGAVERGNSGQIQKLRVTGNKNGTVRSWDVNSQYSVRLVLRSPDGTLPLRSSNLVFGFEWNGDGTIRTVTAYGGGYGHGIGLCQNGAYGMAQQGYSYRDILRLYYTGATLDESLVNGCSLSLQSPADGTPFIVGSPVTLTWSGMYSQYALVISDANGQPLFNAYNLSERTFTVTTAGWPAGTYSWQIWGQTDSGSVMGPQRQFVLFVPTHRLNFPAIRD